MNCEDYTELISAALDGVLSPEEQRALDGHLAGCPRCRSLMEELSALDLALADCAEDVPDGFAQRVMDAVRAQPQAAVPKQKKKTRWPQILSAAAVLVLVVAGGSRLIPWDGGRDSGNMVVGAAENAPRDAAADNYAADGSGDLSDSYAADGSGDLSDGASAEDAPALFAGAASITSWEALELAVDRVSDGSGYQRTLTWEEDRREILLTDGDTVMDRSTVFYEGMSANGTYYLFSWQWDGQSREEAELYRYAVSLTGDEVLWRGACAPDPSGFDQAVGQ